MIDLDITPCLFTLKFLFRLLRDLPSSHIEPFVHAVVSDPCGASIPTGVWEYLVLPCVRSIKTRPPRIILFEGALLLSRFRITACTIARPGFILPSPVGMQGLLLRLL